MLSHPSNSHFSKGVFPCIAQSTMLLSTRAEQWLRSGSSVEHALVNPGMRHIPIVTILGGRCSRSEFEALFGQVPDQPALHETLSQRNKQNNRFGENKVYTHSQTSGCLNPSPPPSCFLTSYGSVCIPTESSWDKTHGKG